MEDMRKTKQQLAGELAALRQRVAELEAPAPLVKQAEETLRETEQRFSNLLDNLPIGLALSTPGAEGQVTYANPALWKTFGYDSQDEFLKVPASGHYYDPEERRRFSELCERGPVRNYETRFKHKDGTVFWASVSATPLVSRPGLTEFVNVFEDITEYRQAEETMRRQRDELSARARVTSRLLQTFDLEERLNTILDEAMALVKAEMGNIWLRSGEELLLRCWKGIPDDVRAQVIARQAQYELPWLREFTVLHELLSEPGQIPRFAKEAGVQALASIPLTIAKTPGGEAEWLGTLVMASRRREALNEADVAVIRAMAEQLALAVDHSLQFQQASQRLARLDVLRTVDRGIIGHLSIPEILAAVVGGVPREMGADAIAISLFSPDRARTQVCLLRLPNGTVIENEAFTIADSLLHWFIERQEPVIIYDLSADPRLQMHRKSIGKHRLASYLGMPLVVEGRTIGIMHILTAAPKVFAPEDVEFFQTLAGQAAIAIRSAGLYQEVQMAEQKYRAVFNNTGTAMAIFEEDGTISLVNSRAEELFGYSRDELEGKKRWDRFLLKEDLETMMEYHRRRRIDPGAAPSCYESHLIDKAGRVKDVLFVVDMIPGTKRSVASVLDITERKQAEAKAREMEALKEVDRLRAGLLANVSHELRTPLTSILGFTSTLLRTDTRWSEEEQRDFLQSVQQESSRLARLINDLLDMSRLESGAYRLKRGNYDIAQMLEQASRRLASLTEHHRLEVKGAKGLPLVFIDEDSIWQVLTNLVDNAAKFSSPGSQITIEARPAGDEVIVSVIDRGQGIPAALLDKVFDRFYQAESIVSGRKKGTGLGLSIVKGIVEGHGGRTWVESERGQGSCFSFSLPVSKGE